MSSTPQTRGFEVGVVPGYQLANPSYFNPYANLSQGLQSGVQMGGQLQDIILRKQAAEAEAQMRPLRQQLLQAEVTRARDEAQLSPLRQQLLQSEVTRAGQQTQLTDLQMPGAIIQSKEPIRIKQSEFLDLDDQGNLAKFGSFKVIDPTTGEVGHQPRAYLGTVKTKDQLEQEHLNSEALRTYREGLGNAAQQKAATAEQIAAWKQKNPTVRTKTVYDKDLNVYEQAINPDGSLGASVQVVLPNGQPAKRPASQMDGLAAALGALAGPQAQTQPVTPAQTAQVAAGTGPLATAPAGNLDALGSLANQFAAPTPPVIQTKEQYDALPPGTTYIDSMTGQRHTKGK